MKKKLSIGMSLILLMAALFIPKQDALAASNASKAKLAYMKYFGKDSIQIDDARYNLSNNAIHFMIKDINNDKVPEFILCDTDYLFGMARMQEIYTYYNGKVVEAGSVGHGGFNYYGGVNVISGIESTQGYTFLTYCKLSKGKLVKLASREDNAGTLDKQYVKCYVNNKSVAKSSFDKYIKSITKSKKGVYMDPSGSSSHLLTKDNVKKYCSK